MSKKFSTLAFAAIISCAVISANPASADVTPTLDKLHAQDPVANPMTSAYTLTPTEETSGTGVYDIPEYDASTQTLIHNYYKLDTKIGVVSETRMVNTSDNSATNYSGHYLGQNITSTTAAVLGGAIYNNGTSAKLGNITGDFINNYASTTASGKFGAYGGAIANYNKGIIGNITGDFIGNSVTSASYIVSGSAIYNNGAIGNIAGNFINNISTANATNQASYGAIYNTGTIGNIDGTFIGNSIDNQHQAFGGAISNANSSSYVIGNITGTFINNSARSYSAVARGGAIFANTGSQYGNISGYFVNNFVEIYGSAGKTEQATGGAIAAASTSKFGNIDATFVNNYVYNNDKGLAAGGAIRSSGATFGYINGDFIENYVWAKNGAAYGGGLYNDGGTLGDISGNYTNNYAQGGTAAYGGAIYNNGTSAIIGDITGDFTNNSVNAQTYAYGGAIYNDKGTVGDIKGNFANNSLTSGTGYAYGSAIYNTGATAQIGDITGDFINNSATSTNSTAYGTIFNSNGVIGNITGNFYGNTAISGNSANGGAIYNSRGTIGSITGNFADNSINGQKYSSGGAINNNGNIANINGDFLNNMVISSSNSRGGAIYNTGTIGNISGNFINNCVVSETETYLAFGGAILHRDDGKGALNLVANNRDMIFSGNYTQDKRGKIYNAIYVENGTHSTSIKDENDLIIGYEYKYYDLTVNLDATNNGRIIFNDNIDGGLMIYDDFYDGTHHAVHLERRRQYDLNIKGDSTGKVYLNNDVFNANITHDNVTTNVSDWKYLSHAQGEGINSLTMNSGTLNIPSLTTEPRYETSYI